MSAVREIAEREAAEAEAEFPDEEVTSPDEATAETTEPEPEPETSDAPEEAATEEQKATLTISEETWAKIDTKVANYKKGMQPLLEETGQPWLESPFDVVPGYMLPYNPNAEDALAMKAAADLYFAQGGIQYKPHPTMVTCEECDGYGLMTNGAKGDRTPTTLCWCCHGSGTRDLTMPKPQPPQPAPTLTLAPPVPAVTHQPWEPAPPPSEILSAPVNWHASGKPGADQWDRWPGHPRYGIDPATSGGVW